MSVDPTTDDADARRVAWADYRKEYGVPGAGMTYAHKAFIAGWEAARDALDRSQRNAREARIIATYELDKYRRELRLERDRRRAAEDELDRIIGDKK